MHRAAIRKVAGGGSCRAFGEGGAGVVQRLHFREGEEEGKGGFGALVLVCTVGVQPVAAAARGRIVKQFAEVIGPEEPVEGTDGFGSQFLPVRSSFERYGNPGPEPCPMGQLPDDRPSGVSGPLSTMTHRD